MNRAEMSTEPPVVPARLDVKVGFACNNRCRFCVQGMKRERFGTRDLAEIVDILQQNRGRDGVVFTGGEPTLHPRLLEMVSVAREMGYRSIQIQTNGRMFSYKAFCRDAIAAGVTEVSPALHGHMAGLHEYLTTVEGSFQQTIAGIRNLKEMDVKIVSNTVITRTNFRHLSEVAELLVTLGVDQYQLAFVHPVGSAGPDRNFASVVPRFELVEPFLHQALEIGIRAGRLVMTEAVPYCFMEGFEQYVGERIMPSTKIFDAEGVIEEYRDYRLGEGKAKGPRCALCRFDRQCEGPWKEYTERFGWDEFVPQES